MDDDDRQRVTGYLPKQDLDGNPITSETLGAGGSRREDGTISKLVEDLTIDDDEDDNQDENRSGYDDIDPDSIKALITLLVTATAAAAVTVGVQKATPVVKRLWREKVAPRLETQRQRIMAHVHSKSTAPSDQAAGQSLETTVTSTEIELAVKEEIATCTAEEALTLYLEMMTGLAYAAERIRKLKNARIEAPEDYLEVERLRGVLESPTVIDDVNRQIEAGAANIAPELVAEFVKVYGGGGMVRGKYLPLEADKIQDVLRLPVREEE